MLHAALNVSAQQLRCIGDVFDSEISIKKPNFLFLQNFIFILLNILRKLQNLTLVNSSQDMSNKLNIKIFLNLILNFLIN